MALEEVPPPDFGSNDGPDMAQAFDVIALRQQLAKAEAFLATIVKGVSDPNFYAAKYFGGYEAFDKRFPPRSRPSTRGEKE